MASWTERLSLLTQTAVDKGKDVAEITRINIDIAGEESSIRRLISEIGKYVVDQHLLADDPTVSQKLEKICACRQRIDTGNARLRELKGQDLCPSCGGSVARGSKFCDKCGAMMPIADAEVVPAQKKCPGCGEQIDGKAIFCPNCGAKTV